MKCLKICMHFSLMTHLTPYTTKFITSYMTPGHSQRASWETLTTDSNIHPSGVQSVTTSHTINVVVIVTKQHTQTPSSSSSVLLVHHIMLVLFCVSVVINEVLSCQHFGFSNSGGKVACPTSTHAHASTATTTRQQQNMLYTYECV